MRAIILVGGFGTRLQSIIPDVPKPMAPVHDKPFLAHLLQYLKKQGITSVIFSVHYLREKIQNYFQSSYEGLEIYYAEEDEPLGTGGAIVNSLNLFNTDEPIFVLNGDTFVKLDYQAMYEQHLTQKAQLTMALRFVEDCERYGKVIVEDDVIMGFKEKGERGAGLINAGVYLLDPKLFTSYSMPKHFSFEKDFLFPHLTTLMPRSFTTNDYFIDIGIPEDYHRALIDLKAIS